MDTYTQGTETWKEVTKRTRLSAYNAAYAWAERALPWGQHGPWQQGLELKFRTLAAQWRRETAHESSERRRINHPAYRAIVDLKWDVVPLLLHDIDQGAGDWFAALAMITGDDVSAETTTYQDAVSAWRDWGIRRGYLP